MAPLIVSATCRALVGAAGSYVADRFWQKRVAQIGSGDDERTWDERADLERAAARREGGDHPSSWAQRSGSPDGRAKVTVRGDDQCDVGRPAAA
jgi:hypothetical protein